MGCRLCSKRRGEAWVKSLACRRNRDRGRVPRAGRLVRRELSGRWLELTTDTFKRPVDLSDKSDPDVRFARSYLRMRLAIGVVGILLPFTLWLLEGFLLKRDWQLRGSLSAYYYSGARDVFVGAHFAGGA